MTRFLAILLLAVTAVAAQEPASHPVTETVTFNKDVLPILQRECQACHRPGEAGPMSFLTYESTRPWAKAIKQAVLNRKMPPWFADPLYGDFRNRPQLLPEDVRVLSDWADSGAAEGDTKDKPAPVVWQEGWRINPDVILSMPEPHKVPAKGSGEIESFFVTNPFPQDTWVSAIEVRPGNPSVVHHVMLQVPDAPAAPSFSWGATAACAPRLTSQRDFSEQSPVPLKGLSVPTPNQPQPPKPPKNFAILETVYAPGSPAMDFGAYDSAKLIPGGGLLRIEVHYTPNGTATSDLTRIGFKLAKEPPRFRYITLAPKSLANARKPIPAGESDWQTRGELEFGQDAQLVWLMPHMHLRGKDMTFRLISPNGASETVLSAKFNFNWQLGYEMEEPLRVRRGTRMVVVAHHDNSANNPFNPDPTKEVSWGNLTSEEMVLPWFGVLVSRDADPEKILTIRQDGCSPASRANSASPLGVPRVPAPNLPTLPTRPIVPNFGK